MGSKSMCTSHFRPPTPDFPILTSYFYLQKRKPPIHKDGTLPQNSHELFLTVYPFGTAKQQKGNRDSVFFIKEP